MKKILFAIFVGATLSVLAAPKPPPPPAIISTAANGLRYDKDEQGNRVPDFSTCGYAASEKEIPDAPVRVVVAPTAGDETAVIQRAIDHVASLSPDANGLRGAVLLLKGRHEMIGGLQITNPGVVLRGQGMGDGGTVLFAAGLDRRTVIRVVGRNDMQTATNAGWQITDAYVPVGATRFQVEDPGALKVGDAIRIIRPSTQEWIVRLGATELGGGEGAKWKPGSRDISWNRTVKALEGDLVTVDAPLTTALDSDFGGGRIELFSWPGRLSNIGIENLTMESAFDPANPKDENHSWCAITMENAADCWVRQVRFQHFAGSAVALYESCQRVTVEDCLSLAPVSEIGGYRRNTFFTMGQQTLFIRCHAGHGGHDFSVGHCAAGPNAFVQCEASLPNADSGGIESWSSGTLFDSVRIDGNAITLGYRPGNNTAIGWAAANSVLWNCSASVLRCWNPPGAQNWSFGSWASYEGDGVWRRSNEFVSPDSLFAAQLRERLGGAGARVPLMPAPRGAFTNPSLEKAQELAAEAHQPAPLLADYIAAAATRNPIPCEPGDARHVEEISNPNSEIRNPKLSLVRTNGWLTVGGRLLIGGTTGVRWWRGNIRPMEASSFGFGVTRFVPGRIGWGFTDDLDEVGMAMEARGLAALDHNYGLWYDRRRDDHERVRRIDGEVLPPFLEQPFARSGQGTAWEGLSKYDLTKFNPWYWSRLSRFAEVCEERGLVLFHQNYFQHNILEAGAHWADFPWRSANNINNTGFPEPPPYAGDKRIFQAELFYDVSHPVRRELHRNYIRHCLNSFTNRANVLQFTSAEFTGPLHFVQFWVDTIAAWKREHPENKPLVALSCTKDVQDAILADEQRSATVDVIDFRYWWRTGKGEFAPPGGRNLAPRQFGRRWGGGRPNDLNLAHMAAEYHAKYPAKPLICDFDAAGWAWVCAGGSIPNLPKETDQGLLSAIPRMQPWAGATGTSRWVLRERGRQLLVYVGTQGPAEVALSGETGTFALRSVNLRTGKTTLLPDRLTAGEKVSLEKYLNSGPTVLWLVKE